MKIVQLTAENVKKLKVVDITPSNGFIQITGKNGSGKSSVLDSIFYALAGKEAIPEEPIRKGEEKATIRLDLGEIVVIRRFSKSGTTLVVENAEGFRAATPQAMLDAIVGKLTFDPLEFSRMDAKKQFATLRDVAEVKIDFDEQKKANEADVTKRRDINRDIAALEGQVAGIAVPDDAPDMGVSVVELMEQLNRIEDANTLIREEEVEQEEANRKLESIDARRQQITKELLELDAEVLKIESFLKSAPRIVYQSTDAIKAQIAGAELVNAAYQAKIRKGELNGQIALKQKASDALTDAMAKRKAEADAALAESKMPIVGLTLGADCVLYNDTPFGQLSSAEQLRVSVAIAMAANPKLKIIRIKDGSLLDEESMKILQEMTAEKDYQAWVERVETSGKIGIVMEDGAIKTTNEEAA